MSCHNVFGQRCTEGGVGRGSLVGRTPEEETLVVRLHLPQFQNVDNFVDLTLRVPFGRCTKTTTYVCDLHEDK